MIEPEEIIEANLRALLVNSGIAVSVFGALAPVQEGDIKACADSFVNVIVDQAGQILDTRGGNPPEEFSVQLVVHVAFADDPSGRLFRDSCRLVRGIVRSLSGDGCSSLNGNGFACDEFMLNATSTTLDSSNEDGTQTKTYNAAVSGRMTNIEGE